MEIARLINIIGANLLDGANAVKVCKMIKGKTRILPLCFIHLSFILL